MKYSSKIVDWKTSEEKNSTIFFYVLYDKEMKTCPVCISKKTGIVKNKTLSDWSQTKDKKVSINLQ